MTNLFNSEKYWERVKRSAETLSAKFSGRVPDIVIQRGSAGPRGLFDIFKTPEVAFLSEASWVNFKDIGFPGAGMQGHEEKIFFLSTSLHNSKQTTNIAIVCGRHHYYQSGNIHEAVFSARVFAVLGVKKFIFLNAAGGLRENMEVGDIYAIRNGNTSIPSPNMSVSFNKVQFLDPNSVFDISWYERAEEFSDKFFGEKNKSRKETNPLVYNYRCAYFAKSGPEYESEQEVVGLLNAGYDVGGMSTVPEAWAVKALNPDVSIAALSLITNVHGKKAPVVLTEDEVSDAAKKYDTKFSNAVWCLAKTA